MKRLLIVARGTVAAVWPFLIAELLGQMTIASGCTLSDAFTGFLIVVAFAHVPVLAATVFELLPADVRGGGRVAVGALFTLALLFFQMWGAAALLVSLTWPCGR
jgi:hypothetical protein